MLIQNDVKCLSDDERFDAIGSPLSINECINACKNKAGCRFIIAGINEKSGECYMEKTANEFCPEGWEPGNYNFYMIEGRTLIFEHISIIRSRYDQTYFQLKISKFYRISNFSSNYSYYNSSNYSNYNHILKHDNNR